MQTTEKLDIPFELEINMLARIQVQQSEIFNHSISKQFEFFSSEYNTVIQQLHTNKQTELIKKIELVNFMFELHMESFQLPKQFEQSFHLLKIITVKSSFYHSAFFMHNYNPVVHYISTTAAYIKDNLSPKNTDAFVKQLNSNIQTLLNNFQSDPSYFDIQSKVIINSLKKIKGLNNKPEHSKPSLKTSSLNDRFSHKVSHNHDSSQKGKNNKHLLLAKSFKKGEWLNLKKASKSILIKLIWVANDQSEFIFVNKDGEKVKQCNLLELASDLENSIITTTANSINPKQRNTSFLKTIG